VLTDGVDDTLRAVGDRLLAAAQGAKAYGLAAAHIGAVAAVVVISPDVEPRDYTLLFNPKIEGVAAETAKGEEGSVSLPDVRVEVVRPVWAEIAFMDRNGASVTRRFEGFAARVALHEIEQMQGTFFLERVSRLKREMALKKARKLAG
jgi:peptide deformylase